MKFRLFSHKHQLYTGSSNWPSNQRTWSEWSIVPDGRVLEIIFDGTRGHDSDPIGCQYHDCRDFSIEPWTGLYDIFSQRIYKGDVLGAKKGIRNDQTDPEYSAEVIWMDSGFYAKDAQNDKMFLSDDVSIWKSVFVKGNVHNVLYFD